MASHETYVTVCALEAQAQRALLADGDAVERLWAAWALAMRLAKEAAPELVGDHAAEEPVAGIRRQLVVIAAGLGEAGLIRVLAQGDPNARVRATGCQYLIATSGANRADLAEFLRFCLFADPSPIVREEILRWSRPDIPPLTMAEIVRLAHDASPAVRRWAAIVAERRFAADEIATSGLLERLDAEDEAGLLIELARLALKCNRPGRILQAAEVQEGKRRLSLLDLLIGRDLRFAWPAMETLAALRDPAVDRRVVALMDRRGGPVAFAWLVHAIAQRTAEDRIANWRFLDASWPMVADMIDSVPVQLIPAISDDLAAIMRSVDEEASGEAFATDEGRQAFFVGLKRRLIGLIDTAGVART